MIVGILRYAFLVSDGVIHTKMENVRLVDGSYLGSI